MIKSDSEIFIFCIFAPESDKFIATSNYEG